MTRAESTANHLTLGRRTVRLARLASRRWPGVARRARLARLLLSSAQPDSAQFRRLVAEVLADCDHDVVLTFTRGGLAWSTDVGDGVGWELFAEGSYEARQLAALLRWASAWRPTDRFPNILDVGANVGTTTVPLAVQGFRVLSIEPVGRTFNLLRENVIRNGLSDRVHLVQAAIVEHPGSVQMATSRGSGLSEIATGSARFGFEHLGFRKTDLVSVEGRRLDDIASEYGIDPGTTCFVWADVQGTERSVIESGRTLWSNGVPLWLEIWPCGLELHGGQDTFIYSVTENFASFAPEEELLRRGG